MSILSKLYRDFRALFFPPLCAVCGEPLAEGEEQVRGRVEERLDELIVALRAVPFEVVTISHDPSGLRLPPDPVERLYAELLSRVNQRVSAASSRVLVVLGGRVLDLSGSPLLGTV